MSAKKINAAVADKTIVAPDGGNRTEFALPSGTAYRIMYNNCKCDPDLLYNGELLTRKVCQCVGESGLQAVRHTHFDFDGGGVTAAVVLAESHLVLHSWPEFGNTVLADISVCNYERDNRPRVAGLMNRLEELLRPEFVVSEPQDMLPRHSEHSRTGCGNFTEITGIYAAFRSKYQDIKMVDTMAYGRALILDGYMQTTEAGEHWYHESLVHAPLLAHPAPQKVLICGGGDGGAAEEALKHPTVTECDMVELDEDVVNVSRNYLFSVNRGAFDDPRLKLTIEDAFDFLKRNDKIYDAVILDLTDPIGECEKLFSAEFFGMVAEKMTDEAKLAVHSSFPVIWPDVSRMIVRNLRKVFGRVMPFMQYVPCYNDYMMFSLASGKDFELPDAETLRRRIEERKLEDLEIITPDTYRAMFALAPAVRKIVE